MKEKLETVFTLNVIHSEIIESVKKDIEHQNIKGQNEYGTTMDRNDLSLLEWLKHAYFEGIDKCIYLKKAITILENENNNGK